MESTGKYYIPVYNALEGYISNVVVANPKWVAVIKGEKYDNKDAKWIAIARKILVAIYHILSTGETWNSTDLDSSETSDKDRIKFTHHILHHYPKCNFCTLNFPICTLNILSFPFSNQPISPLPNPLYPLLIITTTSNITPHNNHIRIH